MRTFKGGIVGGGRGCTELKNAVFLPYMVRGMK